MTMSRRPKLICYLQKISCKCGCRRCCNCQQSCCIPAQCACVCHSLVFRFYVIEIYWPLHFASFHTIFNTEQFIHRQDNAHCAFERITIKIPKHSLNAYIFSIYTHHPERLLLLIYRILCKRRSVWAPTQLNRRGAATEQKSEFKNADIEMN